MRWGLLLVVAAATAGSSCFYDLESYRSTEGTGGQGTSTTSSQTTTVTTTNSVTVTSSVDASSSGVGGGLPMGLPHCQRETIGAVEQDAFDTGQSCNTIKFLWRPSSPFTIDDCCPPQPATAGVSILAHTGQQLKLVGALGQLQVDGAGDPLPRHPLVFDECYLSIKIGELGQLGPGIYAYAGLVTGETNASSKVKVNLRPAHGTPTIYGAVIDSDRLARAGSESAPKIGQMKEFLRVGESNGMYALETKDAADSAWTTLVQAEYMAPQGELYFGFGLFIKNDNADGTAQFDDYNLDP